VFIGLDGNVKLGDFGLSKGAADDVFEAPLPEVSPIHVPQKPPTSQRKRRGASIDLDDGGHADVVEVHTRPSSPVGAGCGASAATDQALQVDSVSLLRRSSSNHTSAVGTRSYASPEQLGGSAYDEKSDMYRWDHAAACRCA